MRRVLILWVLLLLPLGLLAQGKMDMGKNQGSKQSMGMMKAMQNPVTVSVNSAGMSGMNAKMKKMMQEKEKKIQDLEARLDELEKKVKVLENKDTHLVLGNLKFWGYLRMRYVDSLDKTYSAISLEEITFNLAYHPADYITAWINVWWHPNQISLSNVLSGVPPYYPSEMIGYTYFERAQAELKLPTLGKYTQSFRIGKWYRSAFGIPPKYPNRKISDYSLVAEAFTHDRVTGIEYISSFSGMINFAVSVFNGLRIGDRPFGPNNPVNPPKVKIIADREMFGVGPGPLSEVTDNDKNKGVSVKLGYQWPAGVSYSKAYHSNGKYFQFDIFGTNGNRLTNGDLKTLTDSNKLNIPVDLFKNRNKYRAGADMRVILGRFSSDAEFFYGYTGGLEITGFHILGVYKVLPGRFDFLARYAELDTHEDFSNHRFDSEAYSALWNKRQIQLSLKTYLAKWAWIQTEYYFNFEGPKGDVKWNKVKNDVFFIEFVFFYM